MRQLIRLAICAASCLMSGAAPPPAPALELDHVWVVVSPGAPERAAFERAGFRVWPAVQRHEGQGTASVMVELDRGFIELLWRDSSVSVTPGRESAAKKFALRSEWRTSGWSPIGIGLRRTPGAPDSLPFSTWPLTAEWRAAGDVTQMITARADSTSPSVWVVARSSAADNGAAPDEARVHPNGARRITGLRLTVPRGVPETEAMEALRSTGSATVSRGDAWLLEITLDAGRQGRVEDLRPILPVIVRH